MAKNIAFALRIVTVVDTKAPVFEPLSLKDLNAWEAGTALPWPNLVVSDLVDRRVRITNNVTSAWPLLLPIGDHAILFSATDQAGNTAELVWSVSVVDTTAPVIMLLKYDNVSVPYGVPAPRATVQVVDNVDFDLKPVVRDAVGVFLGCATAGLHQVGYYVNDTAGNAALPAYQWVTVGKRPNPSLEHRVSMFLGPLGHESEMRCRWLQNLSAMAAAHVVPLFLSPPYVPVHRLRRDQARIEAYALNWSDVNQFLPAETLAARLQAHGVNVLTSQQVLNQQMSSSSSSESGTVAVGAAAGIGVIVLMLLGIMLLVVRYRRRQRQNNLSPFNCESSAMYRNPLYTKDTVGKENTASMLSHERNSLYVSCGNTAPESSADVIAHHVPNVMYEASDDGRDVYYTTLALDLNNEKTPHGLPAEQLSAPKETINYAEVVPRPPGDKYIADLPAHLDTAGSSPPTPLCTAKALELKKTEDSVLQDQEGRVEADNMKGGSDSEGRSNSPPVSLVRELKAERKLSVRLVARAGTQVNTVSTTTGESALVSLPAKSLLLREPGESNVDEENVTNHLYVNVGHTQDVPAQLPPLSEEVTWSSIFYHPELDRNGAERLLLKEQRTTGSFLLRPKLNAPDLVVISIRLADRHVLHVLVKRDGSGELICNERHTGIFTAFCQLLKLLSMPNPFVLDGVTTIGVRRPVVPKGQMWYFGDIAESTAVQLLIDEDFPGTYLVCRPIFAEKTR